MPTSIFHIGADNVLTELRQTKYESEDLLQRLLADHPSVLEASAPDGGRLLLIRREFGVPEGSQSADRWSLDHLFVDQSGVPVLMEVKRAEDTRSRREVVAQMLDYAANGVAYWPIDRMVAAFQEATRAVGQDPEAVLGEFIRGTEPDAFWRQVDANLRAGRVRMIFAADRIPPELRRIVEFLNEQMRPAEVLAIELEHFADARGVRTLVPRLIGKTQRAEAAKAVRDIPASISEDDWFATLALEVRDTATRMAAWFRDQGFQTGLMKSQDSLQVSVLKDSGKLVRPFFIRRSTRQFDVSMYNLMNDPAYASVEARKELIDQLRTLLGESVACKNLDGWASLPLDRLVQHDTWLGLQAILTDVANKVRRS